MHACMFAMDRMPRIRVASLQRLIAGSGSGTSFALLAAANMILWTAPGDGAIQSDLSMSITLSRLSVCSCGLLRRRKAKISQSAMTNQFEEWKSSHQQIMQKGKLSIFEKWFGSRTRRVLVILKHARISRAWLFWPRISMIDHFFQCDRCWQDLSTRTEHGWYEAFHWRSHIPRGVGMWGLRSYSFIELTSMVNDPISVAIICNDGFWSTVKSRYCTYGMPSVLIPDLPCSESLRYAYGKKRGGPACLINQKNFVLAYSSKQWRNVIFPWPYKKQRLNLANISTNLNASSMSGDFLHLISFRRKAGNDTQLWFLATALLLCHVHNTSWNVSRKIMHADFLEAFLLHTAGNVSYTHTEYIHS